MKTGRMCTFFSVVFRGPVSGERVHSHSSGWGVERVVSLGRVQQDMWGRGGVQ